MLKKIKYTTYIDLKEVSFTPHEQTSVVFGKNRVGKTLLYEAIMNVRNVIIPDPCQRREINKFKTIECTFVIKCVEIVLKYKLNTLGDVIEQDLIINGEHSNINIIRNQSCSNEKKCDNSLLDKVKDFKQKVIISLIAFVSNMEFIKNGAKFEKVYLKTYSIETTSLLVIDDFADSVHCNRARDILKGLGSAQYQTILTSHNTAIITSDLLKTDNYFNISENKNEVLNFQESTDKELRESHDLRKIYESWG